MCHCTVKLYRSCCGFPDKIPRCTLQWNSQIIVVHSCSGQMFCCFRIVSSILGKIRHLMQADLSLLLLSKSEMDSSSRLTRPVLAMSLVVCSLSLCSSCSRDSLMMSGACQNNNRTRFASHSSNPSVPMSFAVYLDLREDCRCVGVRLRLTNTKSSPRIAILTSIFESMFHRVCLFQFLPVLHKSNSQSQVDECVFRTCS